MQSYRSRYPTDQAAGSIGRSNSGAIHSRARLPLPPAMVISAPLCHGFLPFSAAAKGSSACSRRRRLVLAAGCHSGPVAATAPVADAARVARRRCECFDLHQQTVPFAESWARQKSIVKRRKGLVDSNEDHTDTLIALQHPPVYTLGTGSSEEFLHFDVGDSPYEVHRIDRGGEVTYHGPGQVTGRRDHPCPSLRIFYQGINSKRPHGVWVGDQKVAAIGIHCSRYIVYHGLALNVTTDLAPFERIVPCGIKDRRVGSVKDILQRTSNGRELNDAELMDIAYESLIKEFAEIFQLSLEPSTDLYLQPS